MGNQHQDRLTLYMPTRLKRRLRELAEQDDQSISQWVRERVRRAWARRQPRGRGSTVPR